MLVGKVLIEGIHLTYTMMHGSTKLKPMLILHSIRISYSPTASLKFYLPAWSDVRIKGKKTSTLKSFI